MYTFLSPQIPALATNIARWWANSVGSRENFYIDNFSSAISIEDANAQYFIEQLNTLVCRKLALHLAWPTTVYRLSRDNPRLIITITPPPNPPFYSLPTTVYELNTLSLERQMPVTNMAAIMETSFSLQPVLHEQSSSPVLPLSRSHSLSLSSSQSNLALIKTGELSQAHINSTSPSSSSSTQRSVSPQPSRSTPENLQIFNLPRVLVVAINELITTIARHYSSQTVKQSAIFRINLSYRDLIENRVVIYRFLHNSLTPQLNLPENTKAMYQFAPPANLEVHILFEKVV